MKRLMAILTALSLVLPFTNAKAEGEVITDCSVNSSCFVYTPGDEVNFYRNEDERKKNNKESGQTTIILEDAGANSKYVKVLALSPFSTSIPYFDKNTEREPNVEVKKEHMSSLAPISDGEREPWTAAKANANGEIELGYITLDQLITVFGATKTADGTYTIDATKWGSKFEIVTDIALDQEEIAKDLQATATTDVDKKLAQTMLNNANRMKKGFYTSTFDAKTNKAWAVEYTITNKKISAITVKQVDVTVDENTYAYLPVVSFDKTYDCHSRVAQVEMGCFECDSDYKWLEVGTQAETCVLVPNVTSKGTCVKAVKTGVEDYILEFGIIASICGIALFIAKKKDLFKSI